MVDFGSLANPVPLPHWTLVQHEHEDGRIIMERRPHSFEFTLPKGKESFFVNIQVAVPMQTPQGQQMIPLPLKIDLPADSIQEAFKIMNDVVQHQLEPKTHEAVKKFMEDQKKQALRKF